MVALRSPESQASDQYRLFPPIMSRVIYEGEEDDAPEECSNAEVLGLAI